MADRSKTLDLIRRFLAEERGALPTVVVRTLSAAAMSGAICYGSYWLFGLPYWDQPFPMLLPVLVPLVVAPWFIHFQTVANLKLKATEDELHRREAQLVREIEERTAAEHRAQDERQRAEEASRAKSRFLSNVSHEIRTPLNSIIGFSELLHTETLDDRTKTEYAGHIHEASGHLLLLINDVLDLARIEAGKVDIVTEELDAALVAERAIAMVEQQARAKGVSLRLELKTGVLRMRADRRLLVQMLLNLLSNAVKFTPASGEVTVSGRLGPDGTVELSVADTGRGMSAEQIERMLEPFERGDDVENAEGGTGLGLGLVKSLVEMHGGRLMISSEPGRGTRATLALPGHA